MIKLKDILTEGLYMGPAKNAKVDLVHVRHKTSEKELVIVKSALKRYNKLGFLAYNPKDKYKYGSLKWDIPMGMKEGKLNELKPMSGKPEIGDYLRSGKLFGKIVELETRKGKKLAGIEPSSGMPSGFKYGQWGTIVFFEVKRLVMSKLKGTGQIERNVGKPIWEPK